MKQKLLIAAAIVVVVVLGAIVIATPKVEAEPPLPKPNGYDDFVKATTLVEPNPPDWLAMQGEEMHIELSKLAASNQPALELARAGLAKESRMVPWEMNATNGTHLNDLSRSRGLAQAFAAASRLALLEGHTNGAASLAIDCIRYGNDSVRGGVLIDGLVGLAIKNVGLKSLSAALDGMDVDSTRNALSALDAVANRSESSDEILKRERRWARRGRFGSAGILSQIVQPFLNRKALEKGRQRFTKSETEIRRMQIQLATHAYELEHSKPPTASSELVPQYLKSIPLDPETGKELPLN